jgi:ferredoxin
MPPSPPEPPFAVTVEPAGWRFAAAAGLSVLEAALAAGIRLPSSCRNGTCRECRCQLVRGTIHYRIEWPGLSADEKREGCMLPCVAEALSDLVIQAPRATRDPAGPGQMALGQTMAGAPPLPPAPA